MKNSMSAVGGACCTCGGEERRIQGFGKSEGKRPLGRHWRKWEDNIKMDLQEVEMEEGHGLDRAGSG